MFFISWCSFSQSTVSLKGKIIDFDTQQPLEAATVYLTREKDSTIVDYTISDQNGIFELRTRKISQPLLLKVSFLGYAPLSYSLKSLETPIDIGVLQVVESADNLDEVIIKAEAPPVRIKNDTLEFNASSFKVRPDANVQTLLKQLPGVEIDNEGKITINGKEVNQILVNGKPFFDKDGKIALQNLPADIIEKIQVTDTKTKEEEISGKVASSNNSSINLTIQEDKNKGFFGKITGGYGSSDRYESSLMANYFKGERKISLLAASNNINATGFSMDEIFDSMGGGRNTTFYTYSDGGFGINGMRFGGGRGITQSHLAGVSYADQWVEKLESNMSYFLTAVTTRNNNRTVQETFLPDNSFTTRSISQTLDDKMVHNFSSDFEMKVDSTSTVYFSPRLSRGLTIYSNESSQVSVDTDEVLLNESESYTRSENNSNSFESSLYWHKRLSKKERWIGVTFDNEHRRNKMDQLLKSNNRFYQENTQDEDNRNQITEDSNDEDGYFLQMEYNEPVKDSVSISFGIAYENKKSTEDRKAFDFSQTEGDYTIFNEFLSIFTTSQNQTITPETGLQVSKKKLYARIRGGAQMISFDNHSLYLNERVSLNKKYILPSLHASINYRMTNSKALYFYYNYSVNLPTARQILPVENLANPMNSVLGNPEIDPGRYHYGYLSYRNYDYATKSGYSVYLGGNIYGTQIVASTVFDDSRRRVTTYENVADTYYLWFGGNYSKSIKGEASTFKYTFGVRSSMSLDKGFTNSELFQAKSISLTPKIDLSWDYGEILSINPSYSFTYRDSRYENYIIDAANNVVHSLNFQATSYWPQNLVLGNDFGYTYNSNIADGFQKDFFLWNTSIAYSFYQKKLMAKIKVYDVLNQNISMTRTITSTGIRDEENMVLRRYVMFSLTYKLDKFGAG